MDEGRHCKKQSDGDQDTGLGGGQLEHMVSPFVMIVEISRLRTKITFTDYN
jgi:hypothetical protein